MYSLILLGLTSFSAALLLTPLIRNFFLVRGVVDRPNHRKLHPRPIPRVGGLAVALAYVIAFMALFLTPLQAGHLVWSARAEITRLLPAALVIFAVGLLDDLLNLTPSRKLLGQVLAAGLAWFAGVQIHAFAGHALPYGWSLPLTILWLLLCTNAVNLIDGIDGLATGLGLFATTTTLIAALLQGNIELALATAPLAGALLGFLRYNFNPATIFLGDSGSLFIGFLLGCFGVLWSQKSATILGMTAPLMALAIPLLDTGLAIVRRFLHGKPIFGADRGHIHHRLLDRGFTPRKVALVLYACCALGASASLGVMNQSLSGFVIVLFCAATWIGIQHLGYVEFGVAGRMFVDGAFRRHLNTHVSLHGIQQDLAAAHTPQDCWNFVENASREFGFHHVRMEIGPHFFESRDRVQPLRSWTLHIPLGPDSYVQLARPFDAAGHATAVAPFADLLRRSLTPKLQLFSTPAADLLALHENTAHSPLAHVGRSPV